MHTDVIDWHWKNICRFGRLSAWNNRNFLPYNTIYRSPHFCLFNFNYGPYGLPRRFLLILQYIMQVSFMELVTFRHSLRRQTEQIVSLGWRWYKQHNIPDRVSLSITTHTGTINFNYNDILNKITTINRPYYWCFFIRAANDTVGANSTIGAATLIYEEIRKRGKIGLNQSLIHIHPFPPLSPQFFFAPLQLSSQKHYS